eukprot:1159264-Pelagomonas_calceolata.AAC.1
MSYAQLGAAAIGTGAGPSVCKVLPFFPTPLSCQFPQSKGKQCLLKRKGTIMQAADTPYVSFGRQHMMTICMGETRHGVRKGKERKGNKRKGLHSCLHVAAYPWTLPC